MFLSEKSTKYESAGLCVGCGLQSSSISALSEVLFVCKTWGFNLPLHFAYFISDDVIVFWKLFLLTSLQTEKNVFNLQMNFQNEVI